MAYIYPKFSKYELPGLRLGGPGLGNLLFVYARARVAAQAYGLPLIWPTWPSLKLGPWLRRERDKRLYAGLFQNRTGMVGGLKKQALLRFARKLPREALGRDELPERAVVLFDDFRMDFEGLIPHRDLLRADIFENLSPKSRAGLADDYRHAVNFHVRLGDFTADPAALRRGENNVRIDIEWYAAVARALRALLSERVTFNIFSDGDDGALAPLLAVPGARRRHYGSAMADIVALSRAPLMVASGSSFSLWARFLGQCASLSYPGQMKARVLAPDHPPERFEATFDGAGPFDPALARRISELYST